MQENRSVEPDPASMPSSPLKGLNDELRAEVQRQREMRRASERELRAEFCGSQAELESREEASARFERELQREAREAAQEQRQHEATLRDLRGQAAEKLAELRKQQTEEHERLSKKHEASVYRLKSRSLELVGLNELQAEELQQLKTQNADLTRKNDATTLEEQRRRWDETAALHEQLNELGKRQSSLQQRVQKMRAPPETS